MKQVTLHDTRDSTVVVRETILEVALAVALAAILVVVRGVTLEVVPQVVRLRYSTEISLVRSTYVVGDAKSPWGTQKLFSALGLHRKVGSKNTGHPRPFSIPLGAICPPPTIPVGTEV